MYDIINAIEVAQEALHATPRNQLGRERLLSNLEALDQYILTGTTADLEEITKVAREAVNTAPEDHPDQAHWRYVLRAGYTNRYLGTREMPDLEIAIQRF